MIVAVLTAAAAVDCGVGDRELSANFAVSQTSCWKYTNNTYISMIRLHCLFIECRYEYILYIFIYNNIYTVMM